VGRPFKSRKVATRYSCGADFINNEFEGLKKPFLKAARGREGSEAFMKIRQFSFIESVTTNAHIAGRNSAFPLNRQPTR
jgi:hypothetical protein